MRRSILTLLLASLLAHHVSRGRSGAVQDRHRGPRRVVLDDRGKKGGGRDLGANLRQGHLPLLSRAGPWATTTRCCARCASASCTAGSFVAGSFAHVVPISGSTTCRCSSVPTTRSTRFARNDGSHAHRRLSTDNGLPRLWIHRGWVRLYLLHQEGLDLCRTQREQGVAPGERSGRPGAGRGGRSCRRFRWVWPMC